MFVLFNSKRGPLAINTEKVLFLFQYGKYTRVELDDGTPLDIEGNVSDITSLFNIKNVITDTKV